MKSIRVMVTGGLGMLGREFARLQNHPRVAATWAPGRAELDVRDAAALLRETRRFQPDWLIHCAGLVDVEGCARDPDHARAVIVEGTRNAVTAAASSGARFFYPQSFLVYDGVPAPVPESEPPRPLALYGELKFEAERLARNTAADCLVVRMAGFFGGEEADKNFVGRIIPHLRAAIDKGQRQFAIGDRVWQPTWTRDLAENSLELMLAGKSGVYQMASHGHASFAELAAEIVAALGWSDVLEITTVPAATVSANELGKRPDVAILSCQRLRDEALDLQRDWRATLHAYLRHPFFDRYRLKGA